MKVALLAVNLAHGMDDWLVAVLVAYSAGWWELYWVARRVVSKVHGRVDVWVAVTVDEWVVG